MDTGPAREVPKQSCFGYHSMDHTLTACLYQHGRIDRLINKPPVWLINQHIEMNGAWGPNSQLMSGAFHAYCLAMFDAGYYGIAQINMHGRGQSGQGGGTDHWVLLCGMRRRSEGNSIIEEILIGDSCPTYPVERWIG